MTTAEDWATRQAHEDFERKRLNRAFLDTPSGWHRGTPQPVWHKPEGRCQLVFEGMGLRLFAACPVVPSDPGYDLENELLILSLICIDGSTPNEAQRAAFQQAFFPDVGAALLAVGRSPMGVFTYHLPMPVVLG